MLGSNGFLRSLVGAAIVALLGSSAYAQTAGGHMESERRVYVAFGLVAPKVDDLNGRLSANGYETIGERTLTLGAGGQTMTNRWIFGLEGNLFVIPARASSIGTRQIERSIRTGNVLANFGRQVVSRPKLSVSAFVGIGAGGMLLKFTDSTSTSFDQVLANPRQGTTMRVSGFLVQAGIAIDRFVALGEGDGAGVTRGITVGVRAGYVFGPLQGDWKILDSPASGGPEIGITGPYVRVLIGGGSRRVR